MKRRGVLLITFVTACVLLLPPVSLPAQSNPSGASGVDRLIPTVMRPNHLIYVRDDAPDDFAYAAARALDEHRDIK